MKRYCARIGLLIGSMMMALAGNLITLGAAIIGSEDETVSIGIGQLLAGNERLTLRLLVGRALSTGGLAMAAGVVLVWVPELSMIDQINIACCVTHGL